MSQAAIRPSALRPGIVADLHTHSTCSDGRLSPEAIIDRALALGLRGLSITDHDNLAGSTRAAAYLRTLRESGFVPEDFIFVPLSEDISINVYKNYLTGLPYDTATDTAAQTELSKVMFTAEPQY